MSLKLGQSIQYEAKDLEASSYSLLRVVPLSGSMTQTVSLNSGTDVTFELPVQAINMARSYIYMDVSIPAQGAGLTSMIHQGICPFSSMQIFTRGGQYLLNLQERATDYSRVVISADSQHKDLVNGDDSGPLYRSAATTLVGELSAGDTASPYFQQEYLISSAANAVQTYRIVFPMSALKHTICSVDKSILYREVLVCKFKLAPSSDIAFQNNSTTDPTSAPLNLGATGGGVLDVITYSNISFYVAQERNASVVEALNAQTESESGFSLLVPYPSVFTNQRSAATTQNVTLRLNKSHGSSLKAIKHCVFANAGNNSRYDRNNRGDAKVTEYYTNVNNNRLTEFNIDTSADLDWMLHKRRLMNTPALNNDVYKLNWFHEDRFDDYQDKLSDMSSVDTNVVSGINLNEEIRWDIYATTVNAAHRHFSICHGQKLMNINARGLVLG